MSADRHLEIAIARAWPVVAALVARLVVMAGLEGEAAPVRLSRPLHTQILRLLRPAEAIVRRLIVLMAREIELARDGSTLMVSGTNHATMRALPDVFPHGERRRATRKQEAHSNFQLFETLPTLAAAWRERRDKTPGPGPRILSLDAPFPVATMPEDGVAASPVLARIRGLERVLKDPTRRAKRHANFLGRKARANAPHGRINPVRPGHAPGSRSRYTPPDVRDLLAYLTAETRAGPVRKGPTLTLPRGEGNPTATL